NFERCYNEDEIKEFFNYVNEIRKKFPNIKIVPKIACKIEKFEDNLKILKFFENNYKNCILLGMGKEGKITRILNHYFGFLTYVSIEEKTAEGQLNIDEFKEILKILD
ncbi:MAG: type I 3-dehydroquinate dehydratase, partial [Candidatus Altarchaeaceae archaeon]